MKKSSLLIFALSALATQAQITPSTFSNNASFVTGMMPVGIDHADFDGDGKQDVVVTNYYDNNHNTGNAISVYHNQYTPGVLNSSTFTGKTDFTIKGSPQDVVAKDMDGDGKADLVVANYVNPGFVSILRNTSTVGVIDATSFAAKVDFGVEANPSAVAVGDIDGDGKPDVVAATNYSISILRNISTSGTISMQPALNKYTGFGFIDVQLGDADGDGKLDIIAICMHDSTFSVFRNISTIGTIAFEPRVEYATPDSPYGVNIADIDGDGKNDVLVASAGANYFSVFRNVSTGGSFTPASFLPRANFAVGSGRFSIIAEDLDADGKKEVIVGRQNLGISVYKNNSIAGSSIAFQTEVNYSYPFAGSTFGLTAFDYDNDGDADLAGTNYDNNNGRFSVLRNDPVINIAPDFTFSVTNLVCAGANDGSITLTTTVGTDPFQYSINGGSSFQASNVFNGLMQGTYNAVVKNAAGSSPVKVITLIQADSILPVINGPSDITVTANGCNAVVTYATPIGTDNCTGAVTKLKKGLASGSVFPIGTTQVVYEVTDASGNKASYSFKVIVKSSLTGTVTATTYLGGYNISCNGKSNGQATAAGAKGCGNYTYEWNTTPVQFAATATGLSAGTYKVKITDANANTVTLTINLTQPAVLTLKTGGNATVYSGYAPLACTTLDAKAKGGVPNYTYLWSNGSTSATPSVCPSVYTDYTVSVTDANGCTATSTPVSVCVVDVHCGNNGNVSICHKTVVCSSSGKTKNEALCIPASAVEAHLAHGDKLGACGTNTDCKSAARSASLEDETTADGPSAIVYPNPFSSDATLEFRADVSERTAVEVYNTQGVLVAKIFDAVTEAGEVYHANIDGSQWAKGLYLVKIVNVNGVQNLKLVLTN